MAGKIERKDVLSLAGAFLGSYGMAAFVCFLYLSQRWAYAAPLAPDPAHGYIYAHNEHGRITYLSAFQATACVLLFPTSIPVAILGVVIAPKRDIVFLQRRFGFRYTWKPDDPKGVRWIGFACGAVAAPLIVSTLGRVLISALNSAGIVLAFG